MWPVLGLYQEICLILTTNPQKDRERSKSHVFWLFPGTYILCFWTGYFIYCVVYFSCNLSLDNPFVCLNRIRVIFCSNGYKRWKLQFLKHFVSNENLPSLMIAATKIFSASVFFHWPTAPQTMYQAAEEKKSTFGLDVVHAIDIWFWPLLYLLCEPLHYLYCSWTEFPV